MGQSWQRRRGEYRVGSMTEREIGRRAIVGGVVGTIASAIVPYRTATANPDGPPPLQTVRHQFTLLRPARFVPSTQLMRIDGPAMNIPSLRGKVVLVHFWATWCLACRVDLPRLDRLQESQGDKDLAIVAVSLDRGGRPAVASFLRHLDIRHLNVCLDPEGRTARPDQGDRASVPFTVYGMPISYIVGRTGRIEGYLQGAADWTSDEAKNLLGYYLQS
jgi:thiol-disulfide isomerase/thioredoxin